MITYVLVESVLHFSHTLELVHLHVFNKNLVKHVHAHLYYTCHVMLVKGIVNRLRGETVSFQLGHCACGEKKISFRTLFLRSNHQSVEGVDHQSVVQLIRLSGNEVNLVVISVSDDEARRLEPENAPVNSSMDYYERRSVPVTIPDTQKMTDETGKEYVAFNIYMAGKRASSRRYREFDALANNVSIATHTHTNV